VQRLIEAFRGKPEEQALKIGLLKSLKRARYATVPLGHYGLAKTNYAHFTSPIRRYADLVVHRSLVERIGKRVTRRGVGELNQIAEQISITERIAADAELESVKMKKLEFLQQQITEQDPQVFRAVVIEVRNYGLLVELPEVLLTGLVHVSSLQDDFYAFDPARRRLIGRQSRRQFAVGDVIKVIVARVDQFKQQADFAIVNEEPARQQKRPLTRRARRR